MRCIEVGAKERHSWPRSTSIVCQTLNYQPVTRSQFVVHLLSNFTRRLLSRQSTIRRIDQSGNIRDFRKSIETRCSNFFLCTFIRWGKNCPTTNLIATSKYIFFRVWRNRVSGGKSNENIFIFALVLILFWEVSIYCFINIKYIVWSIFLEIFRIFFIFTSILCKFLGTDIDVNIIT